jgi:hypothetical protein
MQRDLKIMEDDLKDNAASFPTSISMSGPVLSSISRQACPFVGATLQLMIQQEQMTLTGTTGNPTQGSAARQHSMAFRFEVGENDGVFVVEPFGENSKKFHHPDELAKYIIELLFNLD